MTQPTAHFVFTPSGAGCLVQALRKAGRDDPVVASFDDFGFGPINPPDPSLRAAWAESELGSTEWQANSAESERDWHEARFPDHRKVAWLTRRSAMEYAGFLEWLWRLDDAPCEVVDLSEVKIAYRPEHGPRPPRLAMSLGMLHHETICDHKLWDLAEPLRVTNRSRYLELWQRLRSENAPLRVVERDKLVSAPISFFDSVLMSRVTDRWQKVSRVVGEANGLRNGRLDRSDRRYVSGGSYQRPGQVWSPRISGRIRPRNVLKRGEVAEAARLTFLRARTERFKKEIAKACLLASK